MPSRESRRKNPWLYRRFCRLFRREKPSLTDVPCSYQYMMRFPRLPITVPPLVPALMSYRWNDEDDCEASPKKLPRDNYHQQHARRRLPKRYSDIVGPSITKAFATRKDSTTHRDNQIIPRLSLKSNNKNNTDFNRINSHHKKSREIISSLPRIEIKEQSIVTRRYSSKNKRLSTTNAVDLLAHRMQAAMSTELMYSLDRNFVFGDKKQSASSSHINRSQSFNISTSSNDFWEASLEQQHYYHIIPRVSHCLDEEQKSIQTVHSLDEPTPDYDEEIIIRPINNDTYDDIGEEPIADYDDPQPISTPEFEEKSMTLPTHYDLGVSSSFIIPQTSITPSSETCTQDQTSIPPTPPPLPFSAIEQKNITFRCRTIADKITADHKLILKDELETITTTIKEKQSVSQIQQEHSKTFRHIPTVAPKPNHLNLSKELLDRTTLRKVSHPISRSYSSYGSMSQLNDHHTESTVLHEKSSIIEEQPLDGLISSTTTSIVIENDYERKSSSKIYNDYKRRASLLSVPTDSSTIIHPMHTHIGLRSSTSSSSTNDKLNDITLSNKQMNVCVINQLNEHLSTRFRKQHHDISSTTETTTNQPSEDIPTNIQSNVYDVPHDIEIKKSPDISSSSMPPPPPPLPAGGFRPLIPQLNRPLSSQRTSIMTLPCETNGSDLGSSRGTSTASSKLSDTRILRELRTNPLFTKAKQHLEINPNRRLIGSSVSYLRLDTCSNGNSSSTVITDQNPIASEMETFIMCADELNPAISNTTKRTKSMNSIANERNKTRKFLQAQCRQSELEIIFQKRAQRSEHNLT